MNREEFNFNWAIETDYKSKFTYFKNFSLDTITKFCSLYLFNGPVAEEFLYKTGHSTSILLRQNQYDGCTSIENNFVKRSRIYSILSDEDDEHDYIFYLQIIINCTGIQEKIREKLFTAILENIDKSNYLIQLIKLDTQIYFLPKGIPEFTDELISKNYSWLGKFPLSKKSFENAIKKYKDGFLQRNLLDDLRLSLELLLKELLNNSKSIENQKEFIGKYLKENNVSTEISNMFLILLDYYSKYQNNYVKHDDQVKKIEIDFILYLTGIFMNLISKTN